MLADRGVIDSKEQAKWTNFVKFLASVDENELDKILRAPPISMKPGHAAKFIDYLKWPETQQQQANARPRARRRTQCRRKSWRAWLHPVRVHVMRW